MHKQRPDGPSYQSIFDVIRMIPEKKKRDVKQDDPFAVQQREKQFGKEDKKR